MEIRFERRASPLVCVGLVILSVVLFAWRVYVQVLQRERRLLAKKRKSTEGPVIETKVQPKKEETPEPIETKTKSQVKSPLDRLDDLVSDDGTEPEDTEPITEPVAAEEPTHQGLHRSSLTHSPGSILHRSASNVETSSADVHNDKPEAEAEPESQNQEVANETPKPQKPEMNDDDSKSLRTDNVNQSEPESKGPGDVKIASSVVEEVGHTSQRNVAEAVESEAPVVEAPETGSEAETSDEEGATVRRSDAEAERLKLLGNEKYSARDFDQALECYSHAIDACPRRSKTLASILFCNMAAVHFSEQRWEECIQCCSDSIELDPNFVKAYIRRYRAHMAFKKYTEAAADLSKALEIEPNLRNSFEGELAAVERLAKEQFEKDKAEMLGKLKDFGNWALGKVGMSLDNFQVIQDPQTGGYNIQYQPPEGPPPPTTDAKSS
eukprot:Protomagalhaensia_wolfi_Nauph_80__2527@NODE_268_length_2993_cov_162_800609_g200_i0_p2_GENE_NODE_268_length_2993_cov_162_800609_g200_i0NODE_268_length_2993_cov_162_800609_g200_i0_p2_ORF_typecomplete_len438_score98_99TPR_11/PF13414_6/0_00097TPR_11/PF13414_6/0_002TPR_11/PF13414_6/0_0086TPR_1/PF00515_28/0_027TPR_1/PF00515_28/0_00014TPR_1/PF00515_28/0_019TPR_2/PF07719_17/0_011TPR_2/PF07719_17/0_0036TPR_2/PF07719_17/0_011TPR_9/PF13371_6/3_2TPR_9/PF13371_6/1_4e08TPR_16/PF13432_6/0_71TPR_16/PF13432_6/1_